MHGKFLPKHAKNPHPPSQNNDSPYPSPNVQSNPEHNFGNKKLGIYGEVDILLENGDYALLVEVKTNLKIDDVREHQERLKKFRLVADAKNDPRKFIAAVGGGVARKNVRDFALKQGMFVVQQTGENVEILAPKGEPMVW